MSDLGDYFMLLPVTLLLARGDSFFKKSLISAVAGIIIIGSIFFMGNPPSSGDGMEMIIPMFFIPAYFFVLAGGCLICGIFSAIMPKFEAREKNKQRIQNFKGEWVVIIMIIVLGGILIKHDYLNIYLPLKDPIKVPSYKITEIGKTKKSFTVIFENGFGYHFDQKPTDDQIENLYKERAKLLPKTPALDKQYERHIFYGVNKDIAQLVVYRKKIGQFILAAGYPGYLFVMFIIYLAGAGMKKIKIR